MLLPRLKAMPYLIIDAIRCVKLALDRSEGGILEAPSAYFCKHPPRQFTDDKAYQMVEDFIVKKTNQKAIESPVELKLEKHGGPV